MAVKYIFFTEFGEVMQSDVAPTRHDMDCVGDGILEILKVDIKDNTNITKMMALGQEEEVQRAYINVDEDVGAYHSPTKNSSESVDDDDTDDE